MGAYHSLPHDFVPFVAHISAQRAERFWPIVLGAVHFPILELLHYPHFGFGASSHFGARNLTTNMLSSLFIRLDYWNLPWPKAASGPRWTCNQRIGEEDFRSEAVYQLEGVRDLFVWIHRNGLGNASFVRRQALLPHWVHRKLDQD